MRGRCYPVWSARTIALLSIPVVAVIAVLVFWISYSSPFVELQITLLVIAAVLFLFLTAGLYRGVRLERPHREPLTRPSAAAPDAPGSGWEVVGEILRGIQLPDIHLDAGDAPGGDDLLGCIGSILAWIVITFLAAILLWLLTQILWATLLVSIALLYWVFYRALRVVFYRSRACKGKLLPSLGYSLLYTTLYTGWIFGLIWLSRYVLTR